MSSADIFLADNLRNANLLNDEEGVRLVQTQGIPQTERKYLLGFAEGVAAAAKGEPQDTEQTGK